MGPDLILDKENGKVGDYGKLNYYSITGEGW